MVEIGGQPYAVASTSASADAADAPDGAVTVPTEDRVRLLAEVPGGFGLLVDAATARKRVLTPEQVDGFRGTEPPRGDEPYLWLRPAPPHLDPVITEARSQVRATGAKDIVAFWARLPYGPAGLLLDVIGEGQDRVAPQESLAAAMAVVRRHAPQERVRVVCSASFPDEGQALRQARLTSSGVRIHPGCLRHAAVGAAMLIAAVTVVRR
jgi:hypothetical protein